MLIFGGISILSKPVQKAPPSSRQATVSAIRIALDLRLDILGVKGRSLNMSNMRSVVLVFCVFLNCLSVSIEGTFYLCICAEADGGFCIEHSSARCCCQECPSDKSREPGSKETYAGESCDKCVDIPLLASSPEKLVNGSAEISVPQSFTPVVFLSENPVIFLHLNALHRLNASPPFRQSNNTSASVQVLRC